MMLHDCKEQQEGFQPFDHAERAQSHSVAAYINQARAGHLHEIHRDTRTRPEELLDLDSLITKAEMDGRTLITALYSRLAVDLCWWG